MSTTTLAPPIPMNTASVHRRPGLGRLVAVELRKMVNTRAGFWLQIATVAITALVVIVRSVVGDAADHTFAAILDVGVKPASVLLPIAGILLVTSEWSQRTGMITFAVEAPRELGPEALDRCSVCANHPIGTMRVATSEGTVAPMFPRSTKSPAVDPTLDLLRCPGVGNPSGLPTEPLQDWRRAAQRVVRTYKEWCAANSRDRHHLYLSFLDALGCEERAARQLELDAGLPGAPSGDQS